MDDPEGERERETVFDRIIDCRRWKTCFWNINFLSRIHDIWWKKTRKKKNNSIHEQFWPIYLLCQPWKPLTNIDKLQTSLPIHKTFWLASEAMEEFPSHRPPYWACPCPHTPHFPPFPLPGPQANPPPPLPSKVAPLCPTPNKIFHPNKTGVLRNNLNR